MNGAARQRRHRQRLSRGLIVLAIEVDEVAAVERLLATGFLTEAECDDRHAIQRAVQRVNDLWFSPVTRDDAAI